MINRLVIYGGTGDLTGRFLIPALAALRRTGHLPSGSSSWRPAPQIGMTSSSVTGHPTGCSARRRDAGAAETAACCERRGTAGSTLLTTRA